jgi:SAM-dependent methyltransferase
MPATPIPSEAHLSNRSALPRKAKDFIKSLPLIGLLLQDADSDDQWARIVMNRETRSLVHGLKPENLDVLEISGTTWERNFPFKSYTVAEYPDFDVCKDVLDQKFDLIIAEQVFEHLTHPYRAARNVHQMLRPRGHFLLTTPFLLRIHDIPIDCSRWTPLGMKHFLQEAGFPFERIQSFGWGNKRCIKANFRRWRPYRSWLHSLRNESDFPIVVWALAQKGQ